MPMGFQIKLLECRYDENDLFLPENIFDRLSVFTKTILNHFLLFL